MDKNKKQVSYALAKMYVQDKIVEMLRGRCGEAYFPYEKEEREALQILSTQIHLLARPKYKTQKYKGIKGLDGEM
tara:strand:- start:186 stop:410 length:225 start_codon:yes stop_codon:yes gene_type:complete